MTRAGQVSGLTGAIMVYKTGLKTPTRERGCIIPFLSSSIRIACINASCGVGQDGKKSWSIAAYPYVLKGLWSVVET